MPQTKSERVPDFAIDPDVKRILRVRRLLAKRIPEQMQALQFMTEELTEMAKMADKIDAGIRRAPNVALNEIEGQKG